MQVVTLESLDAKLDRILALVAPVPGPDTVGEPQEWRVETDAPIDPTLVPIGRFGVYEGGTVKIVCRAGKLDSCVWFDARGNVLSVGDLVADRWETAHRTMKVVVKAHCAKAKAQRLDLEMDLFVGVRPAALGEGRATGTQAASARDWSIRHDWPAEWPPVADDGRMPQLPEARDVETLVEYARHGYERDGTPMRGPVSLGFAGNEVESICELTDEAYARSRYGKAGVVRDLACYGLLTKRIKVDYDLSPGDSLASQTWTGVAYPSLEALLARETDMFGGGNAGPGRG